MHKKFANVQKKIYLCTQIIKLCNEYIQQLQ